MFFYFRDFRDAASAGRNAVYAEVCKAPFTPSSHLSAALPFNPALAHAETEKQAPPQTEAAGSTGVQWAQNMSSALLAAYIGSADVPGELLFGTQSNSFCRS